MTGPPARQPRAPDWLTVEKAREIISSRITVMGHETVPLAEALGRTLAGDLKSPISHPAWDNSAMDGYAVRSQDIAGASREEPVVLTVVEDVPAGGFPTRSLGAGVAIKVMTGAPIPEGADGVTRVEFTQAGPERNTIRVLNESDAGRNIRRKGEDIVVADRALTDGTLIGPAEIGVLAMLGQPRVSVYRRPRVAILSTGDELADFDELTLVLEGRRIMNSNSYALAAQVRETGGEPVVLGIARDNRRSLREHLDAAADCDAVLTSAGLAVGEHDYVKEVLNDLGMEFLFYRVKMRPGSPFTFGVLQGAPVFALPGNPVSAMVTFEVLVRPALRAMTGLKDLDRPRRRVRLAEPITSQPGLTHFLRVVLEPLDGGTWSARLTGPQGSGILTSMAAADALLVVPEESEHLPAGAELEAIVIRDV